MGKRNDQERERWERRNAKFEETRYTRQKSDEEALDLARAVVARYGTMAREADMATATDRVLLQKPIILRCFNGESDIVMPLRSFRQEFDVTGVARIWVETVEGTEYVFSQGSVSIETDRIVVHVTLPKRPTAAPETLRQDDRRSERNTEFAMTGMPQESTREERAW